MVTPSLLHGRLTLFGDTRLRQCFFDTGNRNRMVGTTSVSEYRFRERLVMSIGRQRAVDRADQPHSSVAIHVCRHLLVCGLVAAFRNLDEPGPGDLRIASAAQIKATVQPRKCFL